MVRKRMQGAMILRVSTMLLACAAVGIAPMGCGHPPETTRGAVLPVAAVSTVAQLSHARPAQPLLLHGEMIEKCPVAGCWFMLRDQTGVVRVDTKAAGFVVSDLPLHTTLTVAGKVAPGAQAGLNATGIRY